MINHVMAFLKNKLNVELGSGGNAHDAREDQVVFPVGQASDSFNLRLGAVSAILINLEQDHILRAPDPYTQVLPSGAVRKVRPEIKLNIYVLFAAHYQQYEDSLLNISSVIRYFQTHQLFTHENSPELSDQIDRLAVELITLSFSDQNEIWGSLRLPYHPSVLYRVKMIVFRDPEPSEPPVIEDASIEVTL